VRDAAPVIGMEMPLLAFDGPAMRQVQESPVFDRALRYFDDYPASRDLDAYACALLFVLVRLVRPRGAALFEGSSPALAEVVVRGLWENAKGVLHAAPAGLAGRDGAGAWPEVLRAKLALHQSDVPGELAASGRQVDLVFMPGQATVAANADALRKARQLLRPLGIVVLSGVSRPVLEAAQDFVVAHRGWVGLGTAVPDYDRSRPSSPIASSFPGTPFIVLQRGA